MTRWQVYGDECVGLSDRWCGRESVAVRFVAVCDRYEDGDVREEPADRHRHAELLQAPGQSGPPRPNSGEYRPRTGGYCYVLVGTAPVPVGTAPIPVSTVPVPVGTATYWWVPSPYRWVLLLANTAKTEECGRTWANMLRCPEKPTYCFSGRLSDHVRSCSLVFARVRLFSLSFARVHSRSPNIRQRWSVFARVRPCSPTFTCVRLCSPVISSRAEGEDGRGEQSSPPRQRNRRLPPASQLVGRKRRDRLSTVHRGRHRCLVKR